MNVKLQDKLKKGVLGKLCHHERIGAIGLVLIVLFIIVALICPFITQDPMAHSLLIFKSPSLNHLLGTNDVGQDIWSRLIWGTRTSILVAIGVGTFSTLLSMFIGISAGLIGGLYEKIIMRIVDALLVIPTIIVLILIAAFIKPSVWTLIVLISVLHWQGGARILRSQTLSLKKRMHISAARTYGAGRWYLIFRHIIPDLGAILIISFIYRARMAVFMEAGLAFIGIADPSMVSWGMMMHHASNFYYLPVWKWWLVPTGIALSLLILSFTSLGYSLEKVIDPRLKEENA